MPAQGLIIERLPADSPLGSWMPASAAASRPVNYDAPAGAPYTAEQMTLRTPAGITLAGTLTMPSHVAVARMPAVVRAIGKMGFLPVRIQYSLMMCISSMRVFGRASRP